MSGAWTLHGDAWPSEDGALRDLPGCVPLTPLQGLPGCVPSPVCGTFQNACPASVGSFWVFPYSFHIPQGLSYFCAVGLGSCVPLSGSTRGDRQSKDPILRSRNPHIGHSLDPGLEVCGDCFPRGGLALKTFFGFALRMGCIHSSCEALGEARVEKRMCEIAEGCGSP